MDQERTIIEQTVASGFEKLKSLVMTTKQNYISVRLFNLFFILIVASGYNSDDSRKQISMLKVSDNGHFLMTSDGNPFFWLGDTGWLMFGKLTREEGNKYLEDRKKKGFNVIQVMVLHNVKQAVNVYNDSALINNDIATPLTTPGNDFQDSVQYDFWDHVEYFIDLAAEKGLYMALVPVWGSNVKDGWVNTAQAEVYAHWLAKRFGTKTNVIWLNGGDIFGSDSINVWKTIGYTLKKDAPAQLISFHPRGRSQSSWWFHNEPWLDFNMFQSGHRRYDQDDTRLCYGEDNWRYVETDYLRIPVKPVLDGEPSYEEIPQGLHDTTQPYWTADDVRRYAYWSVFSGACGFTYGHNAVMQFYRPIDKEKAYGARKYWHEALNDPGACQMIHLKNLVLSRDYFSRVPDQSIITAKGNRYEYQTATRGNGYAFIYTYTGDTIKVNLSKIPGGNIKSLWYNPRNGKYHKIKTFINNRKICEFDPPGEKRNGNDWVLVLDWKE